MEGDFDPPPPADADDDGPKDEENANDGGQEPEEEEVEPEEKDDGLVPEREDDVALDEVPEHMREAVEESIKLKRALETSDTRQAKRKRVAEPAESLEPVAEKVLDKFGLSSDAAARYVAGQASVKELEAMLTTDWKPRRGEKASAGEQLYERIVRVRQSSLPQGNKVDAIMAFTHRWKLSDEDGKKLRELIHKDLQYVLNAYDGTRPIDELAEEAGMEVPEDPPEKTQDAAPDKPGLYTVSRLNRLELIDPVADALVVGDANLTFSLQLSNHRKGLDHVGRIVATTFECVETLRERYPEIDDTVKILEDDSAEVLHGVDCTRLAVDTRFQGMEGKFGAVYYNFPHAGVVQGFFDGHPFVRWRHENLMTLFFMALRTFVKAGGTVKVSSNANATGVRYSDIIGAALACEFVHVETLPFLEWQLRGYRRSYGDRRDSTRRPDDGEVYRSQRGHSDMVYVFCYQPSGETPEKPPVRYPPTKRQLLQASECSLGRVHGSAKERRVEEMYELFMSYVKGIHVG